MQSCVSKIFVISGPSGSGKSTLLNRLFREYPSVFGFSVSHTTRKPRPGEVNGKDYHFVERSKMNEEIKKGYFIESAIFSGNLYGTSIKSIEDVVSKGRVCMLDIDMQGVQSVKKTNLNPKYIFVQPSSFEILKQRLYSRGTEKEEDILSRLAASKESFDYSKSPNAYDHILINDDFDEAYNALKKIIFV